MGSLEELQSYKFVSLQMLCCVEVAKVSRAIPLLFPDHYIKKIENPLRRINLKNKVKMGELEDRFSANIKEIDQVVSEYDKCFVDTIPLITLRWLQLYKGVSPYLIEEATELFKKLDLVIFQGREEIVGRKGDKSWYAKPESKVKSLENKSSKDLMYLSSENNVDCITVNKLLRVAQEKGIW